MRNKNESKAGYIVVGDSVVTERGTRRVIGKAYVRGNDFIRLTFEGGFDSIVPEGEIFTLDNGQARLF